jgi:hypothetical protein
VALSESRDSLPQQGLCVSGGATIEIQNGEIVLDGRKTLGVGAHLAVQVKRLGERLPGLVHSTDRRQMRTQVTKGLRIAFCRPVAQGGHRVARIEKRI